MPTRYASYSEFVSTPYSWVGAMPAHWELRRGKVLFEKLQRPVRSTDGTVTAFRDGEVTLRSNRREDGFTNALKEIGYQGVEPDDLVIHAMDGFAGAIGVSDSRGKCSPVYSICRERRPLTALSKYYASYLRNLALSGFVESLAKGIRERSTDFRFSDFGAIYFPAPSFEEQKTIAAFLDYETAKIDQLIAKQKRLIALLKEKRQAVISHAVTKGLNPNAPMKDSGVEWLGEVPEHWKVKKLKYLISSIEQGWSPQCENLPAEKSEWGVVKVGSVNYGHFRPEQNKLLPLGVKPKLKYEIKAGDFLVSRANSRELVGSAALVPSGTRQKLLLCDKIYRLKFHVDSVAQWMSYYLCTEFVRDQIEQQATGASDSMQNIGQSVILEQLVTVPAAQELHTIIDTLEARLGSLEATEQAAIRAIRLMKERRSALISAAVTGKIDVRGWVAPAASNTQ